MDKDLDYYNSHPLQHTLEEETADKFSCGNEPLIKIDLDHVVLDELHLLLRVMDVLLNNIIQLRNDWLGQKKILIKKCERDDTSHKIAIHH
jgi:hypothetical protein